MTHEDGKPLHFIAVGGAGMSAVAYLMARRGIPVTGSDAADGPYLRALAQAGIAVTVGHDASLVTGARAVVVSSAVRESNVELAAARALGLPVWHRSEALVAAIEGRRLVAIAGAHGKTTTSAMTARALHGAGIDASFAIGAPVLGVEGAVAGAYWGSADIAVIEADESDGSFLRYHPDVAVVTNVEADHLDHYGTPEAVDRAFDEFASQARRLVACLDDPGAARLATTAARAGVEVVTYGETPSADVVVDREAITRAGERFTLALPVPGWHNRLNATAAWTAATLVGADPGLAAASLASYAGTGRRLEWHGSAAGVDVYDDYAHHPTEIRALLAAAGEKVQGRLVILFQPHLYSRTRLLARDFAAALAVPDADVVLTGIYGAREAPEPGVTARTIGDLVGPPKGASFRVVEDLADAAATAASLAVRGGAVVTVGAGSVTDAAEWVLDALRAREAGGA